jgi:RHS repeat-associated protein
MGKRLAKLKRSMKPTRRVAMCMAEPLEPRTLLTSGPRIVAITPTLAINTSFDHVDVTFDDAITPGTFATDDVTMTGPPDLGPISATGITQLDAIDYRISFGALTERGIYAISVGPDITDPSGNEMDQNQNGVNGEPTDKFVASLEYVVADTVLTSPVTISESDRSFDGKNVAIQGTTATIDGPHSFSSVQLVGGAVLTHSADTATQTHELDLSVTQQVVVDASSKIDVSGKGYLPGRTTGNTTVGGTVGASGGSFGGRGGKDNGAPNQVYGDYADPADWGSGGGSSAGGGQVRISSATLQLDGKIIADGARASTGQGGGSGGGIYLKLETLAGAGEIRAAGGGSEGGASGGGGRIAVYARDLSGFDPFKISAPAVDPYSNSAGTVYLRDTDQPEGTLIIDSKGVGTGVTPLGLPGQTTFAIPDAVVIQGFSTQAAPDHAGLVLDFQNSLTVDQSAALNVEVAGFVTDQAPTILRGATLNISGSYSPTLPPVVTGGTLNVSGDLTLDVPLVASNATITVAGALTVSVPLAGPNLSVTVAGALTSSVPQTINGGTITSDRVVAPSWSLLGGAVLTSLASTATQMHKLEVEIADTLSVDASSKIDVTGKGYLAGRTTGNTTVGGTVGASGGSFGGRGGKSNGAPNQVYGDYADPDDWGSGGGSSAGGGQVRISSATLQLDGKIIADGAGQGGGSGGGIYLKLETLAGAGEIRAAGGGSEGGASGGGGRIAVYYQTVAGFSLTKVTAPAGGSGAGAGTVWIVNGQPHTHVVAHFPFGVQQDFVNQGNGFVDKTIDSISLQFNNPIDISSFDPSMMLIDGQMGQITPTGLEQVGDTTYRIDLPFALTKNGPYNFALLSTAVKDIQGFVLDQNANGIPGEPIDDDYSFTLTVDTIPPNVSHQDPAGDVAGTISSADIWFSEPIDASTFRTSDITIVKPNGSTIAATGIQNVGLNRYRISFSSQTLVGVYHVKIGPNVTDLAGNRLDQNGDGVGGEPADVYDGTFNLVNVDLAPANVTVQPGQLWAGDPATVSWSGQNVTGLPLQGNWIDSVYLSTDNQWDISDTLLTTVSHTGGLTQNQTYSGSATVVLPAVLPGNYCVLVRADVANQEKEGPNKANNVADSGTLAIGVHELTTDDTSVAGTLSTFDPADYYALHVDGGQNLGLVLNGQAVSGGNELYVRLNAIPTRQSFDRAALTAATRLDNQNQQLALTAPPGGGTYYILVYGDDINISNNPYTLSATTGPLVLTEITPSRGSNVLPLQPPGVVSAQPILPSTITISGAGFTRATSVEFVAADGKVYSTTNPVVISANTMTVDITLLAMPAGYYDVRVSKGTATITKPQAFVVTTGKSNLETNLIVPSALAANIPIRQPIWIEYRNTGEAAMPAPLLMLHGDHSALLTTDPDLAIPFSNFNYPAGVSDTVQVIGTGSGATPGILEPGDSGRIAVYYIGLGTEHFDVNVTFTLSRLTATDVSWQTSTIGQEGSVISTGEDWHIDWPTLAAQLRPQSIPQDAWNVIAANLQTQLGNEWGDYLVRLDADLDAFFSAGQKLPGNVATAQGSIGAGNPPGQNPQDVAALWNFEVLKASVAFGPIGTLDSAVDASQPAPGLPLTFTRTYGASIESRFALGSLGRGWHSNWDIQAELQSNGDVVVRGPGGADRYFTLDRGNFRPSPGDFGQLTLTTGSYRLTETDQTIYQFRPDGKLDYVQDTNGNRITLAYNGAGELISLTHSNGQQILLAYDSNGRLITLTEPLGPGTTDDRVTTYLYDASDQHLISVTAPGNRVTTYTYASGQFAAQAHTLTSVTDPGAVIENFGYDDRGRLASTSGSGGADTVQFVYDDVGTVTVLDATSRKATLAYGLGGDLLQVKDGLGDTTQFTYDKQMQLTQIVGPMGELYRYGYDAKGNLTGIDDPLGDQTSFAYDPTFNQLTSFTDARGNGMQYAYDSHGNLISITYADASKETYTYDTHGDVLTSTNRRGQTLQYTYNSAGQVTSKDDLTTAGVDYLYTYDAAGNLTSYTDSTGITRMTYDPQTNFLMEIDYPGGKSLAFAYCNCGRRTESIDQDGHVQNYDYDALGRLEEMTDENGNLIVQYAYDDAGRLSLKTLGNGVYTTYDYDGAGSVLHLINHEPDGSVLSEYDYTYDASGRRTSMHVFQNDGTTINDSTQTYGYDPLGQLTSVDYSDGSRQLYVYDSAGNRVKVIDNGVETDYTTNNLNQYTQVGDTTYRYDADGNMITQTENGVATNYSYNAQNQLVVVKSPTDTWTNTYDALGRRLASSQNGVLTNYVIDPIGLGNLVGEYDGNGSLIARYEYGYGVVSQVGSSGAAQYYSFSAIGSTSEMTDATGTVVNAYAYDPFGVLRDKVESNANPFKYLGEYGIVGGEGPLYTMRARDYSPEQGRFIERDPINYQGGFNFYRYALNNPTQIIDPSGLTSNQFDPGPSGNNGAGCGNDSLLFGQPNNGYVPDQLMGVDMRRACAQHDNRYTQCSSTIWKKIFADFMLGFEIVADNPTQFPQNVGIGTAYWIAVTIAGKCDPPPSPTPDPTPPDNDPQTQQRPVHRSYDPNDKLAPGGFGDAAYIQADSSLVYEIRFENESTATAPARLVVVTDILDPNLDLSTFELTEIEFANQMILIPSGLDSYSTLVPMTTPTGASIVVNAQASLDRATRSLTLILQALDPKTGWYSDDPLVGLLYPEDGSYRGIGSISYLVKPLPGLPSGSVIQNQAKIVFDYNDPISTPLVHNTLDSAAPSSQVVPLPASTTNTTFPVAWLGQDEPNGSGIASYDLYVSVDGGVFFPLLTNTTATSTNVTGLPGHSYAFYTLARDNVSHVETAPSGPDTTIQIVSSNTTTTTTVQASEQNPTYGDSLTFTSMVAAASPDLAMPTGTVQFLIDGADFGSPVALVDGVANSQPIKTLSARSHTISAIYSGDTTFTTSTSEDLNLTIAKASLTVTADDQSKVYGADDPTLTYTVTGILNGDTPSVISGVSLSTVSGAAATAGKHPITAIGGTADNYTITDLSGTLEVSPAPLTLIADDQSMNHYDSLPAFSYHFAGFAYSENATSAGIAASVNVSTTATSNSSAGYYPIHPTAINFNAANYKLDGTQDGTLTIRPKVMDVRVHFGSKTISLIGLNRDLPFINITALDVLFSDDVNVTGSLLSLLGVKAPNYTANTFTYNHTNFDATWTLPSALGVDRLTLALNGVAAPPTAGVGPNIAANPFATKFAVLPGDVDGDGVVSAADGVTVRNAIGTLSSLFDDVNGDGVIDINDFNEVRKRIGSRLP